MTESDFSRPCIIGYGSSPSRCGPPYSHRTRRRRPDTRPPSFRYDPFARDVALDPGRATAPRIAECCLRANENPRPLRCLIFRGSIPHPMQSLCTLRDHCRQWPRNTRYQADATPYLGRTSTGWIAPACGWRTHSITSSARASTLSGNARPSVLAVLTLIVSSYLIGCCTGNSATFAPLRIRSTYDAARLYESSTSDA